MKTRNYLVTAMIWGSLALPAFSQTLLHTYMETETAARAGRSVAIWDDVNGDGFREWTVGIPNRDGVGVDAGEVRVFSGIDNTVLFTLDGATAGARLGHSVANVGDLDSDGKEELAVGAPGERKVFVYSGSTGALLWMVSEPSDVGFGGCVSPAGDANGDGTLDVAASARGTAVITYSGADGSLIYRRAVSSNLGWAMDAVGDIDADGFDDLIVGTWTEIFSVNSPTVILDGETGATLRVIPSPIQSFGTQFGWDVSGVGDLKDEPQLRMF